MTSEQQNRSLKEMMAANRGAVILAVIAVVALGAACVFGLLLLLQSVRDAVVVGVTPTPFSTTAVAIPVNEPLIVGISDSSTITVTLDAPTTLNVKGSTFNVETQVITADGVWSPTIQEGTAVWVYGAIVNYVLGLPFSEESQTLLEQLAPGDEMTLVTRNGTTYTFAFESRDLVPVNDRDVFAQTTPGMTLLLLGMEGQERLVVSGRYVVAEVAADQGNVVELGETAQLEDVQLTVSGATYLPDRPEAPPGFAFYLVDFQIQNVGLTALDTSRLQFTLIDELGNQYAMSPLARQLGNSPPLSGFLNAGQTAQATAGYQIPAGLTSSALIWVVTHTGVGSQVQVAIPFAGAGGVVQGVSVALQSAEASPDLTSLILTGQVTNVGEQVAVVSEEDVSLRTDDGAAHLLLATNPPFPWTVAPGQDLSFSLTFQRPLTADTATFTVLNQPWQLSGLR